MPRKIYYDQRRHRYVHTNSFYGCIWTHYTYKSGYQGVPYADSWRTPSKPSMIHNGKKRRK